MSLQLEQHRQRLKRVGIVIRHDQLASLRFPIADHFTRGGPGRQGSGLRSRDAHEEFAAATMPRTRHPDTAAMQVHQALGESEADAEPSLATLDGRTQLREHLEDLRLVFRRYADAVVAYPEFHHIVLPLYAELDAALRFGVFRGIRQQVRDHLRESHGIRLDDQVPLRHVHREYVPLAVQPGTHGLDGRFDDRGYSDRRLADLELAARDSRDVEQVVEQPAHEAGLPLHDLPRHELGVGI